MPSRRCSPEIAAIHFELGLLLADMGDSEAALRALSRVVELEPQHSQAWRALGDALVQTGDAEGAARAYSQQFASSVTDLKTLEQLSEAELKEAGIVPVTKELVVDLLTLPGGYPHDKSEGLAVISNTMIAVSNDDDFGIVPDGKGGIMAKRLPGENNRVDLNRVYFIKLDKPLR